MTKLRVPNRSPTPPCPITENSQLRPLGLNSKFLDYTLNMFIIFGTITTEDPVKFSQSFKFNTCIPNSYKVFHKVLNSIVLNTFFKVVLC